MNNLFTKKISLYLRMMFSFSKQIIIWEWGFLSVNRPYALWLFHACQNLLITKYGIPESGISATCISFAIVWHLHVWNMNVTREITGSASLAQLFTSIHGSIVCPLWENKTCSPLRINEQRGFLKVSSALRWCW